jgi:Spy/CpxP family protein refolding chaperone
MTKRISIYFIILGAVLMTLPLVAQPGGPGPRGAHPEEGGPRIEKLAELLDLTADQTEQWQALMDTQRAAARAQGEELRATREQIKDLVSAENPELEQLGQLTLDLHRGMEAMKGISEGFEEELAMILTPEQLEKFELLREARRAFDPEKRGPEGRREREGRRGGR